MFEVHVVFDNIFKLSSIILSYLLNIKNVFSRRCLSSNVREEEEEEGLCTLDRINIYVLKSFKENEQTLFSHQKQLKHLSIILNRPNIETRSQTC